MKFAVAALIGSVSAQAAVTPAASTTKITIPQVSWNQTAIDDVMTGLDTYAKQANLDDATDKQLFAKDLVNVYATWEVQNYMTFGKAMKPYVQFEVDFLDAVTVDATCKSAVATKCLNTWLLAGAQKSTQKSMETCITTKAGCATKWDSMTPVQQQALATKYNTSVATMGTAYKKVHDKVMLELATAWATHMKRREAMKVKFMAAAKTAAKGMGCDATCSDKCFLNEKTAFECLGLCKCGTNVIKFTPGQYSSYYEEDFDMDTTTLNLF